MFPFDTTLFLLLNASGTTADWILALARFASLELPPWLCAAAMAVGLGSGPRVRNRVWRMLLAMLLAWFCARLVQQLIPLPRPSANGLGIAWLARRESPGFPSTHASVSFAGAWAIAMQIRSLGPRCVALGLAALIAWSRVCLGLHYPTDVTAGVPLGACCAWFATHASWPAVATGWRKTRAPGLMRRGRS